MGNLFSVTNFFSTKSKSSRPNYPITMIFGKKKRRSKQVAYPMYLVTPLQTDFPIPIAELVNEFVESNENNAIIYNTSPPYLVNSIESPLAIEYTVEPIEYINPQDMIKLPVVDIVEERRETPP